MNKSMRAAWVRAGVVAGAVLVISLLAAPVEAKFKGKVKSTPKAASAPTVSKPHVPDAPNLQTKVETAPRIPNVNVTVTPQNRGFVQRIWDWMFGRRTAPAPGVAPTPVAPLAARPFPVAAAPAAPVTSPVIVPVALPAVAPASPGAIATAQGQGKEKEIEKLPDFTPPPPRPEPVVKGYILHLKNGRRISAIHYEEKGGQIVIPQHGGTFGLSKSLIARIEVVKE